MIPFASAAPRRPFVPSRQQAAFLDALSRGDSHLILEARAGSGKSTTCREGAWSLGRRRSLYCCFNRAIADDFQRDLPSTCKASTMHSLGYRMLRARFGEVEIDKEGSKVAEAAREQIPGDDRDSRAARFAVAKLVSNCKNRLAPSNPIDLDALADEWGVEIPPDRREAALEAVTPVLTACASEVARADFDDLVWLPHVFQAINPSPPDVLFVDEAQDLNMCQHALLDVLNPSGRTVVIGDRWQSIYSFRGADSDSIPRLAQKLDGCNSGRGLGRFPLTITRRCPKAVVAIAQNIVADLEASPDAPEGLIETIDPNDWFTAAAPGSMVLCRTNAPLVSACYQLWTAGRPAKIQGRDIGQGLAAFVSARRASSVRDLLAKIDAHQSEEVARMSRRPNPPADAIRGLIDKCDCVRALCDGLDAVHEVLARIGAMFSDKADAIAVVLSSIHRSKGLEANHVLIVRPDLIPGPWASKPEDRRQELNLAYVAVTRAKQRLTVCGDPPSVFCWPVAPSRGVD